MSIHVLKAAMVYLGNTSIDLSDHLESVEFTLGAPTVPITAMGATYEAHLQTGIKHWGARLNFFQDYDTSSVYAVTYNALTTSTQFPISVKGTTAAVSATNPMFRGNCFYDGDLGLISGGVGEAHKVSISLRGTGAISVITTATA